jgi:hypothetical protein
MDYVGGKNAIWISLKIPCFNNLKCNKNLYFFLNRSEEWLIEEVMCLLIASI